MSRELFFEHREQQYTNRRLIPVAQMCTVAKIHLMQEVLLPDGNKTKILEPGMIIKVANKEMVNCDDGIGTHQIARCTGNVAGTRAGIELFDIVTNQPLTLNFEA